MHQCSQQLLTILWLNGVAYGKEAFLVSCFLKQHNKPPKRGSSRIVIFGKRRLHVEYMQTVISASPLFLLSLLTGFFPKIFPRSWGRMCYGDAFSA